MLKLKKIKVNNTNNTIEADYIYPGTDDVGHIIVDFKSKEILSYENNNIETPDFGMALMYLLRYVNTNETFIEKTYSWY